MRSGDEIRLILKKQVELAQDDFQTCLRDCGMVVEELNSGIPHPDGTLALRLAGDQRRRAFEALQRAISRYDSFVKEGIVPDHLRD